MRGALVLLAALALGAAPLSAGATTVPTLTLTQQAKKAEVILRATPGTPSNVTENGVTWLAYPLTVTEAIVGDPATLPQREGKPVLYVLVGVEGLPELRAGQEAFFLLYRARMDNPIVGFTQGVYPIENGRVTRLGETARTADAPPTTDAGTPPTPGTTATTPTGNTTTGTSTVTPATASAEAANTTPPTPPTTTNSPEASAANPNGVATLPPPSPPVGGTPVGGTPTSATTPPPAPAPATATTPTTPAPPAPGPNAIESDPARFRAALLAARGGQ